MTAIRTFSTTFECYVCGRREKGNRSNEQLGEREREEREGERVKLAWHVDIIAVTTAPLSLRPCTLLSYCPLTIFNRLSSQY